MMKMKRLIAVFAALVLMLSTTGCVAITFSGNKNGTVQGKGNMTTVEFPCGDFSKLAVDIGFYNNSGDTAAKLYYTAAKSDKVTIEIQEDLVQYLTVSNDKGFLTIDSEKSFEITDENKAPKIYISTPMLEELRIGGVVRVEKADKITADSFRLAVSGVCYGGNLDLEVKNLNVDISGVSDVKLNGTADSAIIRADGVSSVLAFGLQTKEADVRLAGVGDVEISCSDKLKARLEGVGGIRYKGNPETTINENGLGRVTKAD